MSLVFPAKPSHSSEMQSTGSQAEISGNSDVSDTINLFKTQVQDLYDKTASLIGQLQSRGENIGRSDALLETLESRVNEMIVTGKALEDAVKQGHQPEDEFSRELEDLIAERDQLQSQLDQIKPGTTQADVDNQQRLLGYVQEEAYRKMEDLCFMKEKLAAAKQDYQREWDDFKTELAGYRKDHRQYQEDIDHMKDLTLARFIGIHSNAKHDSSEKELIRRICTYRKAEREHRQLTQDVLDSEIKCKDLECEIAGLLVMKKEYWKKCLDLENILDELNDTAEEREISLRPATAHQDLTNLQGSDWERQYEDDGAEEYAEMRLDFGHTGRILHRCPKQTNIAICESISDENEAEASTINADAGAVDTATDKLAAKNSGADSNAPQADPEPDQGPSTQGSKKLQMQMPGKLMESPATQTQTTRPATQRTLEEPEDHTPLISKLKKRVSHGLRGSLHRIRGQVLKATGSTKQIDPTQRRGRR